MKQLEIDVQSLKLKHDPEYIGGFKLAGILVEPVDTVFFAEAEW